MEDFVATAAHDVYSEMKDEGFEQKDFDPITISIVSSIIITLIKTFIAKCNKDKPTENSSSDLIKVCHSPNLFQKLQVKHVIKDNLRDDETYKNVGRRIQSGIFNAGKKYSEEKMNKLIEYVGFQQV